MAWIISLAQEFLYAMSGKKKKKKRKKKTQKNKHKKPPTKKKKKKKPPETLEQMMYLDLAKGYANTSSQNLMYLLSPSWAILENHRPFSSEAGIYC